MSARNKSEELENHIQQVEQWIGDDWVPEWGQVWTDEDKKRGPSAVSNDRGIFFMSYNDLTDLDSRVFNHLRRNGMVAPYDDTDEDPPVNWLSHRIRPSHWEKMKEEMFSGSERYAVNLSMLSRNTMWSKTKKHMQADDETVLMNPIPVIDTFASKKKYVDHMQDHDMPVASSIPGTELVVNGKEYAEDKIGHDDKGIVLKMDEGWGGDNMVLLEEGLDEAYDLLDQDNYEDFLKEAATLEGANGDSLLSKEDVKEFEKKVEDPTNDRYNGLVDFQAEVQVGNYYPHTSDLRVIMVGDDIINAERRWSGEGWKTNISADESQLEELAEQLGVYVRAWESLESGQLQHLDVDLDDSIPSSWYGRLDDYDVRNAGEEDQHIVLREGLLPPGARELANNLHGTMGPEEMGYDSQLPVPPLKAGYDLLEIPLDDGNLDHLRDEDRERIMQYRDGNVGYASTEGNGNPGSAADLLARWYGNPEQISLYHVVNTMKQLEGGDFHDTDEIVEIVQNVGDENPEGLNARVDQYYPRKPDFGN